MKTNLKFTFLFIMLLLLVSSCQKNTLQVIKDVKLRVDFGSPTKSSKIEMTKQTPENYFVALKSVVIKGEGETEDFEIFSKENLSSSLVFDFTDTQTTHSLMEGTSVPEGNYSALQIEIYYLQMKLNITASNGNEDRNLRIYLSDDAETENGMHQPGDMTQISNTGTEEGWMLGNGQEPDLNPVSPRVAAYSFDEDGDGLGEGNTWFDFAGKSGKDYGPFGDADFMNEPHPIYSTTIEFDIVDNGGENIILDFNVNNCWQFEDKDGSGAFGYGDLDPVNPTKWQMNLPIMTVSLD